MLVAIAIVAAIIGLYIIIKVRNTVKRVCAWIGGIGSTVASEVKSTKDVVVSGTKNVINHPDVQAAANMLKEDWTVIANDFGKRKAIVKEQGKAGIYNSSVKSALTATRFARYMTKIVRDTVQVDQKLITRG